MLNSNLPENAHIKELQHLNLKTIKIPISK